MFDFNFLNIHEPFTFYLCKPNNEVMYELNGIDEESASLTLNLNNQYDLSFDYLRYVNSHQDELVESNGYHDLVIGMRILVDKIGYFKIKYPPMKFDGNIERKTINAVSIDCELEDDDLVGFKINVGTPDSLEYLVTYDDEETESLINDYTGLPYDYIVFYNTYPEQLKTILGKYSDGTYTNSAAISEIKSFCDLIPRLRRKVTTDSNGSMSITEYVEFTYDAAGENITSIYLSGFNNRISQLITFYRKYRDQLSLISLAIEKCNCNWKIGTIDESLVNKKFQFNVDGKNIYSFLTSDISAVANCVFYFNLFKREIDIVLAKNIGKDSGVIIDRYNLLNSLEVSCNSDSIYTRYNVSGGNKIDIKYVNFGSTRIADLSYFINARNESNQRIYVSDSLAEKYNQYVSDRELARKSYMALTKQYNQALSDIDDLRYKVPNDSLQNDWDSFTDAELNASYKTYHQLLATLQSLYKEDYGKVGCNADGSINENYIRTTEYWYDYYAYKVTIEQITAAIHARAEGSRYADIDNEAVLKKINAYKTEWSLYGTVELENKITAYNNSMQVLIKGEAVVLKPNSQEAKKWSELNAEEKTEYGYYEENYKYSVYMNLYNEKVSCQSYLNQLNVKVKAVESIRDTKQNDRNKLVKLIEIESYNRSELKKIVSLPFSSIADTFTEEEIQTLNLLYVDKNYSNENIFTTSLDTTVSEIDIQYELLEKAKEQLSIESQPQISFNANIENLLVIPEFKNFDFTVGNFVSLEYYDDYYVDMRIISMTFNPCVLEQSLDISFSNFIKSRSERTDMSNILGLAVDNGSDSSSGGSGINSGIFGLGNDIDATISNTMLAKLLNTEMFGTRVSNVILDTIKVNEITAKYAKFEGLAKGTTIIDGKCIMTGYIIDKLYNGKDGDITNTKGSVINLETGKFNFGGGSLKYDGTALSVKGAIYADSGYIGGESGFVISPGKLYSNNHNTYDANVEGVYIGTDYISLGKGGVTWFSRYGNGKIGAWYFNSNAFYWGNPNWGAAGGMYMGTSGLSVNDKFKVTWDGKLTATDVSITGDVYANNGYFKGDITGCRGTFSDTVEGADVRAKTFSLWNTNSRQYETVITAKNKTSWVYNNSGYNLPNVMGVCANVLGTEMFRDSSGKACIDTNTLYVDNIYLQFALGTTNGTTNSRVYYMNGSVDNFGIPSAGWVKNFTRIKNISIGENDYRYSSSNYTNQIILRFGANGKASNHEVSVDVPSVEYVQEYVSGYTDAHSGISSDSRLKKEIYDLHDISEAYMKLHPVSYKYKNKLYKYKPNNIEFGLKADEVADIFPCEEYNIAWKSQKITDEERVFCKDYAYRVDYKSIEIMTVQMVQNHQKQLNKIKNDFLLLQYENSMLKNEIHQIKNILSSVIKEDNL